MEQNIVKAPINEPSSFEAMQKQALILLKSGFLPTAIKTPEQAITIMLTGKELGLGSMEALRSINVIQGKPCLSAQLMLGLCHRTKQVEFAEMRESTDKKCVFVLKRKGSPAYISSFTAEEADKACFSKSWDRDKQCWKPKDNWIKQAGTMLQWRAIAKACRIVFPDAVSGVYTEEEIADDVVIATDPQTREVVVTEIISSPHQAPAKEDPQPQASDMAGESLMAFEMPIGKYKGYSLGKIFADETENGQKKGLQYLQWATSQEAKIDPATKGVIVKFLEEIASGGSREPGAEG